MVGALSTSMSIRVRLLLASGLSGRARLGVALRVSLVEDGPELEGLMSEAMLF